MLKPTDTSSPCINTACPICGDSGLYDWYIHRLEHRILRRLPFKRLQFAVTEFGIDGLIRNDRPSGWRDFADEQGYLRQLGKAAAYLERYSGRMVGCSLFTLGHYPPWGSYDIEGSLAGRPGAARRPWRLGQH